MSYTKSTDFGAKDSLLTGDPDKIVRGAELDDEFDAIQTADSLNLKTSSLGTGVETFLTTPTSTNLAAAVTDESGTGTLVFSVSPALTGIPTVPTAAPGTSTAQIASTDFVMNAAFSVELPAQTGNAGKVVTTDGTNASWSAIGTANQLIKVNAAGDELEGSLIGTANQLIKVNSAGTALEGSLIGTAGQFLRVNSGGAALEGAFAAPQWSIKTTTYIAASFDSLMCDTTSAGFTVTLPASPAANDTVLIADYAGTFATNNLTVGRNGNKIMGLSEDLVISTNNMAITLTYLDATQGWRIS
jgi:hypothetical protein